MKIKLLSAMDTKKKLGTLIVCGALVAALGTASAFAANTISSLDDGTKATYTRGIPDGVPDLMIKIENGVKLYSTDGGKTWSEQVPEGVTETVEEDGKVTTSYEIAPKEGEDDGILSKVENGVRTYSTDGGKTWSEQDPIDADESSTIGN